MNGYRNVRNLIPLALPIVLAVLFISIIYLDRVKAQETTTTLDGVNTQSIIDKPILTAPVSDLQLISQELKTRNWSSTMTNYTNIQLSQIEYQKEALNLLSEISAKLDKINDKLTRNSP